MSSHDQELEQSDTATAVEAQGPARPPRSLGRRIGHILGRGAAGLLVIAVGVTAVLEAVDRRQVQPPGELVELVDGRLLHLSAAGPDATSEVEGVRPTVVLETGAGGTAATSAWLRRELAQHTTVVSYDRAGYGFSDASEAPLEAASVAEDLHEVLDVLGIEGPLVLVGHSLGAGYARVFAAAYPDRVAGLVLLDPVHEEQLERLPAEERASLEEAQQQLEVAPILARLGVFRLSDPQEHVAASLPEDAAEQHRARSVTAAGVRAYGEEIIAMPQLLDEVGAATDHGSEPFAGVPVRVVSAGEPEADASPESREVMESLHRELADRSPQATHDLVEGADHQSLLVDPEQASEVAAVVVDLLDEVADS